MCIYGFLAGLKEFPVANHLGDYNFNLYVHQWPTRQYEKEAQFPLCDWLRQGTLSASDFITHRFPIGEVAEALQAVRERKVIKALLSYPTC